MHANVPVRFGRGRLDSLGNKGLAAYLIRSGSGFARGGRLHRGEQEWNAEARISEKALVILGCNEAFENWWRAGLEQRLFRPTELHLLPLISPLPSCFRQNP
jgi:hypothetical protein